MKNPKLSEKLNQTERKPNFFFILFFCGEEGLPDKQFNDKFSFLKAFEKVVEVMDREANSRYSNTVEKHRKRETYLIDH